MADVGTTDRTVTLDDVIVTHELDRRPATDKDDRQVNAALLQLMARLVDGPEKVLPEFVRLAMELADGISSGISVSEPDAVPPVFRWAFLEGSLAAFDGATTPRNDSPCGVTLDTRGPILARHAERYYSWISDANIVVPEVLLVPLNRGEEQLGTLWIVSDKVGHFNRGHVAAIQDLAAFVSVALQLLQSEQRLKASLAVQESLAREMSHRVKNVFTIVQSLIGFSARSAASVEALGQSLSGRVRALAVAHDIVKRTPGSASPHTTQFDELLGAVLRPYAPAHGSAPRFALAGPPLEVGETATNNLAMVFHELATNAAKYGALANQGGAVEVEWRVEANDEGNDAVVAWTERGGPRCTGAPATTGFGTRLLRETVKGMAGTLAYDWRPEGLAVTLRVPREQLGR